MITGRIGGKVAGIARAVAGDREDARMITGRIGGKVAGIARAVAGDREDPE
jgi:DNA-binding FrmR family transcriptional regulator